MIDDRTYQLQVSVDDLIDDGSVSHSAQKKPISYVNSPIYGKVEVETELFS